MAEGILKFMIGHIGLDSNVQPGLVDFKVCDWPLKTSLNWLITNFDIQSQVANHKL